MTEKPSILLNSTTSPSRYSPPEPGKLPPTLTRYLPGPPPTTVPQTILPTPPGPCRLTMTVWPASGLISEPFLLPFSM